MHLMSFISSGFFGCGLIGGLRASADRMTSSLGQGCLLALLFAQPSNCYDNPMIWHFDRQIALWLIYLYEARLATSMAGTVKETVMPVHSESDEEIKALLKGTDLAWTQYKRDQGTRVNSAKELDAFLDGL